MRDVFLKEKLFNLRNFSLTCGLEIFNYGDVLLPLLHRMSNVEELFLNIAINRHYPYESFIDENTLKNDIIDHLPNLNQFVFNIHSNIEHDNYLFHLSSFNDDIRNTSKDIENNPIVSYIHYFPKENVSQYHIYSYPYQIDTLHRLTNSFPGGLFQFVHHVSLFDEYPFEHEFFIRISQAFPYLQTLKIKNDSPQNNKQQQQHQQLIIKYPHLTRLDFYDCHQDYVQEFLDENRTHLPEQTIFDVAYCTLRRVTNNFTRPSTRINCKKIRLPYKIHKDNFPDHCYHYLPHVKIF